MLIKIKMFVGICQCQQNFNQEPTWFAASLLGSLAACPVGCCGSGPPALLALGSFTGWEESCQGLLGDGDRSIWVLLFRLFQNFMKV